MLIKSLFDLVKAKVKATALRIREIFQRNNGCEYIPKQKVSLRTKIRRLCLRVILAGIIVGGLAMTFVVPFIVLTSTPWFIVNCIGGGVYVIYLLSTIRSAIFGIRLVYRLKLLRDARRFTNQYIAV